MTTDVPISKTKVILPRRRAELLTRRRLLDSLLEALDKKLILISAAAGYGKTSLLIDLAHHSELSFCWLSLDELDRDAQRFSAYFLAALAERYPDFGGQSRAALRDLTSLEQGMERLLVTLVNETYEQINEHFALVLDDFHLVNNVQPIIEFVNRFVELSGEHTHLIVSSRALPDLPGLALMTAREQVAGLDYADLAFSAEEIQALLLQNRGLRLTEEQARKLAEETEGWITGLTLSGAGLLAGQQQGARPALSLGVGLDDYFAEQVLGRQPAPLREFLLRSSLPDEFDAALCETVLGPLYPEPQDWQGWIETVIQNNLFVQPIGADDRWLRYHHLFRDFLRARLAQERPAEITPIRMRLAQAYEARREWEKAYHVYKQLEDVAALAEMIERAGTFMLQRALVTLESWLRDLPPSVQTRPGLLSLRGVVAGSKGNLEESRRLLDRAVAEFRRKKDNQGLTLALVRRATAYRFLGDYQTALRDADEIIHLTEGKDDPEMQFNCAEALRIRGMSLYRLGDARRSISELGGALDIYKRLDDRHSIAVVLTDLGRSYRALGNYERAGDAYEQALQFWREEGNLSWQANPLNSLGILYQVQGEYERAALAFEEGLLCARRSGNVHMEALITIGLGDLYAELRDFRRATEDYRQAKAVAEQMGNRFLLNYLSIAQASLALLQKNVTEARRLLDETAESIRASNSDYERGLLGLACGRLALLEGNPSQAVPVLEEAEGLLAHDGLEAESTWARLWLAAAYHQTGQRGKARQKVNETLGIRDNVAHSLLAIAGQARDWLDGLQSDPEVGRLVSDLFARAGRLEVRLPAVRRQLRRTARVVEAPAPTLNIRAFGRAAVSVGGRPLKSSDWQTQSVRELFFYFLTLPKPATREQVAEALWPDLIEPARLKLRFKNEMYRLRRAVGQEVILFDDLGYSFNRSLDYECDIEAFEAFIARAKSAASAEEQIELYEKAAALVRGAFLEDIDATWVLSERERLSQEYLSALLALADLHRRNAAPEKALSACQRAIEYDVTLEPAYCLSMEIYASMGDRVAVKRTYEACKQAMQRELELPPSKETEELYRRLTE